MVKMAVMTVWIRRLQGDEIVKDQDVDKDHVKNQEVYSKGRVLDVAKYGL